MDDFAVSELRRVDLYFRVDGILTSQPVSYYMHQSQVTSCIGSLLKIHFSERRRSDVPELMSVYVGKFFGGLLGWSSNREWVHPEVRRKEADTQPEIKEARE